MVITPETSFQMIKAAAVTLLLACGLMLAKGDKHPTPGSVYSYYAPHPTTTPGPTITTTTLPPPPVPYTTHPHYEPYYDTYSSPYHHHYPEEQPTSYESGGLYYYYYPANEIEDTTSILEDEPQTTTAVQADDDPFAFDFSGLQKLFIILVGISLAFPSRITLDNVRKKRALIDPDVVDYFFHVKDVIVENMSADKESCIERFICETASREDPFVLDEILRWSQDVGPLLGDLGFHPWYSLRKFQDNVPGGPQGGCRQRCRVYDLAVQGDWTSMMRSIDDHPI